MCKNLNGSIQVSSQVETCPELTGQMKEDFAYEIIHKEGECCKEFKQKACKVGNKEYKVTLSLTPKVEQNEALELVEELVLFDLRSSFPVENVEPITLNVSQCCATEKFNIVPELFQTLFHKYRDFWKLIGYFCFRLEKVGLRPQTNARQ